jgi:DNA-binding MarR family transcriptional regulator
VPREITTEHYRALAELRYRIRHFLRDGDAVVRAAGLEPQQYLLLLMIRGLPVGEEATIRTLAERLALKHHSAVELVDRLEARGFVHRNRGRADRRQVLVSLLPRGERILEKVARRRIDELHSYGRELASAIAKLLQRGGPSGNRTRPNKSMKKKVRGNRE